MTTKFGGELQQPITGITFGCEKILNFGYSSLKSREILGVHSLKAKTLAAISFPCHLPVENKKYVNIWILFYFSKKKKLPCQVSPDGVCAILVCKYNSLMLMPLWRDSVASEKLN